MNSPESAPNQTSYVARLITLASSRVFVINCLGLTLSFVLQLLLTNSLGLGQYGIFAWVYSWLSVALLCCCFGYDTALVRFVATLREHAEWSTLKGLLHQSNSQGFVAAALVALLTASTVILWGDLNGELKLTILIACLVLPVLVLATLRQAVLRGLKLVAWARVPDTILRPTLAIIGIALTWLILPALSSSVAMSIMAIAIVLSWVFGEVVLRVKQPSQLPKEREREFDTLWFRTALPLLLVSGIQTLLNQIDTIMVGTLIGFESTGIYAVAARLSVLTLFGMQAVNMIVAPLISVSIQESNRDELQAMLRTAAKLIIFSSVPVVVVLAWCGTWILGLFGSGFELGFPVLLLLTAGQLINTSCGPVGFMLSMTGYERRSLRILLIALVTNVVLNLSLIHI